MNKEQSIVFLGGTCNNSKWREKLIPKLNVPYFNPVVDNWDEEAKKREQKERKTSEFILYTITPLMKGVYSIAEAVDDSNKRPDSTLFCVLEKEGKLKFDDDQINSLGEVKKMIKKNGGKTFDNLDDVAKFINAQKNKSKIKKLAGL